MCGFSSEIVCFSMFFLSFSCRWKHILCSAVQVTPGKSFFWYTECFPDTLVNTPVMRRSAYTHNHTQHPNFRCSENSKSLIIDFQFFFFLLFLFDPLHEFSMHFPLNIYVIVIDLIIPCPGIRQACRQGK